MRRFLRFLAVGLGLGAASLPAMAGTHWMCGLSQEGVRLVCVADPDDMADAEPAKPAPGRGAVVARHPISAGRQRCLHRSSSGVCPTTRSGWSSWQRATICYRSPGCTVSVAPVQGLDRSRQRRCSLLRAGEGPGADLS